MVDSSATFQSHRPALLALAYRMLGEVARAEDIVQEAWLRWQRQGEVDSPKAFLLTTVARLCLDELGSARARREESRSDRLPEPVDLDRSGIGRVEMLDQISMAFMVVLQRLTPAERAVFLLHEVFDMSHGEIAPLLGKTEAASRQLLRRARDNVATERRVLTASREEHRRLLAAFVNAINGGEQQPLVEQALPAGHTLTAVVRNPKNLPAAVRVVVTDLAAADPAALESAVAGADAVLSGLGARTTAEAEAGVAWRGTQAIVQAMKATLA